MSEFPKRIIIMSQEDKEKLEQARIALRTLDRDVLEGFIISIITYARNEQDKSLKAMVDSIVFSIYRELN